MSLILSFGILKKQNPNKFLSGFPREANEKVCQIILIFIKELFLDNQKE